MKKAVKDEEGNIYVNIKILRKVRGIGEKTLKRVKEKLMEGMDYESKYNPNLYLEENSINHGDCLELMNGIEDNSVDMILADLPYGTTACSWDNVIDLDKLWLQYKRIIKDNGSIVLTASQPFTTELVKSNINWFKHEWIWKKSRAGNGVIARYEPLKYHENIIVFGKGKIKYNPQGVKEVDRVIRQGEKVSNIIKGVKREKEYIQKYTNYPSTIQEFKSIGNTIHSTQKPVELFKYLIKTYTNEEDLVLDNVSGSGTTAIASILTDRNYICIEKEKEYYDKSVKWRDLVEDGMDYKEAMKVVKKRFKEVDDGNREK